jgi:hypothetical protein
MRIVSLLLVAALLAGCRTLIDGPGAGGSATPGTPDAPVTSSPDPSGSPPSGEDPIARESPNPGVVNERGAEIDHFRIGPDGRTVVVYWWGGTPACFALKEVILDVQQGTPIVSVVEGTLLEAVGQACTAEAVLKSTVVVLDDPILVDGSGAQHPAGEPLVWGEGMAVTVLDGLADPRVLAVTGYRLDAEGTTLEVHFVGGTERCYGLAEASVVAGEGALRVTVAEGRLPDADAACEDIGIAKYAVLELDEPLILQAAFNT